MPNDNIVIVHYVSPYICTQVTSQGVEATLLISINLNSEETVLPTVDFVLAAETITIHTLCAAGYLLAMRGKA